MSIRRALLASFLVSATAACASKEALDEASSSPLRSADSDAFALEAIAGARTLDSPAGSGITEDEAYAIAHSLCRSAGSEPADRCELGEPVIAALDDLATQARIAPNSWGHLHGRVLAVLGLEASATVPTAASWPTYAGPQLRKRRVPFFAVDYDATDWAGTVEGGFSTFLAEAANASGAWLHPEAIALVDPGGKVVAYTLGVDINGCGWCLEELRVTLRPDGTLLESHLWPATGYCC
jgi:hypothetical protein